MKVLTEKEIKSLMNMDEVQREKKIIQMELSTKVDFFETRVVIKKMRKEAMNNQRPQIFSKLGEFQAHLDTFDPIVH